MSFLSCVRGALLSGASRFPSASSSSSSSSLALCVRKLATATTATTNDSPNFLTRRKEKPATEAEQGILRASLREKPTTSKKSTLRSLRLQGEVPGVIYGGPGQNPVPISVPIQQLNTAFKSVSAMNRDYKVHLNNNSSPETCIIREVQRHPITDEFVSVDFMRLVAGRPTVVNVPVLFENTGISPGIKRGGMLQKVMRTVKVNVDVARPIPQTVSVDLGNLDVGQRAFVSNLVPQDLSYVEPPHYIVATVKRTRRTVLADKAAAAAAKTE